MRKFVVMGILVMMIAGIWTFLFGCGDTLPHNLANADDADFLKDEYDFEKLAEMYNTHQFDDAFYACYEEKDLTKVLADYARKNFLDEYQTWIYNH